MIRLLDYQKKFMETVKPSFIYECDTGTGKTYMGLSHYKKFFPKKNLLIVAPASKITEGGWQRVINKYYPELKYSIISYHMLPKKLIDYKDYFIIFDECHKIKNSTKLWGKSAYKLTTLSSGFILLSATPIPNGWEDAINFFKMFGLIKNKTQFIKENAIVSNITYEVIDWINPKKLDNMWNLISKHLSKDEAVDLPDLTFKDTYFKKSKVYSTILKDRIYEGVKYDNSSKLRHGLRLNTSLKDKLEYLKDIIDGTNDNIVIFYNYKEELKLLKEITNKKIYVCNGEKDDYPREEEWSNTTNSITLVNYKSGSEAIELTYANIIVYFSPTDSYYEYDQSIGRCYRTGQKKRITVYRFITKGTVEVDIYRSLDNKENFKINRWLKNI